MNTTIPTISATRNNSSRIRTARSEPMDPRLPGHCGFDQQPKRHLGQRSTGCLLTQVATWRAACVSLWQGFLDKAATTPQDFRNRSRIDSNASCLDFAPSSLRWMYSASLYTAITQLGASKSE